jgi:hypothetical protein
MAKWLIERRPDGRLQLTYVNLCTGQTFDCGAVRGDAPLDLLVEWIVTRGDPSPGDWVVTPDGQVLVLGQGAAEA